MSGRLITAGAIAFAGVIALANVAQALTRQECTAKYKAAQVAGTAKEMKWGDFRKAECPEVPAIPASAKTDAKPPGREITTFGASMSTWGAPLPGSARY